MVRAALESVWERVTPLNDARIPPEVARFLMDLRFSAADERRLNDLSEKVRVGSLSPDEASELDDLVGAGHVLAILKSKARQALKNNSAEN